MHPSADGRGRTVWEMLTGRNKKDLTPLEFQYHNPLRAKVGCTITFDDSFEYKGVHFVIEAIEVYKITILEKDFYRATYHCKGNAIDWDRPRRVRLCLVPDEDANNEMKHQSQLLTVYAEFEYDENFESMLMSNGDHDDIYDDENEVTFKVNYADYDDPNTELDDPWRYWRIDEAEKPYKARVTKLKDEDDSGSIDDDELEHRDVTFWDFSRIATDEDGHEITEFFLVEKDEGTGYFTLSKGNPIHARSVTII